MLPLDILRLIFNYSDRCAQYRLAKIHEDFLPFYAEALLRDVREPFGERFLRLCKLSKYKFTIDPEDYKYLFIISDKICHTLYIYKDKQLSRLRPHEGGTSFFHIGEFESEQISQMSFKLNTAFLIVNSDLHVYYGNQKMIIKSELKDRIIGFKDNMEIITEKCVGYKLKDVYKIPTFFI